MLAAAADGVALVLVEIGAVALVLSVLARLAARAGTTAVPFYLLAGLAFGEGGLVPLRISEGFIAVAAEIGLLLLLLMLGLEYSGDELRQGLRDGRVTGAVDAALNVTPGLAAGLLLGWGLTGALVLGGVCWVSSSGIVAKLLDDLDRLGNRETPAVLNLLVVEDLAMAVYLPVVSALLAGRALPATVVAVGGALVAAALILVVALRSGERLSKALAGGNDEALLLAVFGLTLLVAGLAHRAGVSAAIGAFLVGLALSGPVQARAGALVSPLRDLFAAIFFLFFSFRIDPVSLVSALAPAVVLAAAGVLGKLATAEVACRRMGIGRRGRLRAGTALIARGEFSIVVASLAAAAPHGEEIGALAAAFVLLTAVAGPLAARFADNVPMTPSAAAG